jgi:hypothetical protein
MLEEMSVSHKANNLISRECAETKLLDPGMCSDEGCAFCLGEDDGRGRMFTVPLQSILYER